MIKSLIEIKDQLLALSKAEKRNIILLGLAAFLILFSYPLIRSLSTAVFLQHYGAKNSPHVWVWSVVALSLLVSLYNRLQLRWKIHNLYLGTGLFSIAFIATSVLAIEAGLGIFAWPLYVWKEVYIVVMLHMVYGLLNTVVPFRLARIIYGPLGALGSLGGILGGILTSSMAKNSTSLELTMIGVIIIAFSIVAYYTSDHVPLKDQSKSKKDVSPLGSITGVSKYVFLIAAMVLLSQFVINLANFKFNVLFEIAVPDKMEKTHQLGRLYAGINTLAFFLQILVLPILLRFTSLKNVHFAIPLLYLATQLWSIEGGAFAVAGMFIVMKGTDYSIFAVCKELLYFPLSDKQKYGAKYIVDMFCYRFGKGLISFVMIYVQILFWIDAMLYASLALWLGVVFMLMALHQKMLKETV